MITLGAKLDIARLGDAMRRYGIQSGMDEDDVVAKQSGKLA